MPPVNSNCRAAPQDLWKLKRFETIELDAGNITVDDSNFISLLSFMSEGSVETEEGDPCCNHQPTDYITKGRLHSILKDN